jgi:Trk-type K+ transport system membrane component
LNLEKKKNELIPSPVLFFSSPRQSISLGGAGRVGFSFLLLFSFVVFLTIDHGGGEVKKEEEEDREQVLHFMFFNVISLFHFLVFWLLLMLLFVVLFLSGSRTNWMRSFPN